MAVGPEATEWIGDPQGLHLSSDRSLSMPGTIALNFFMVFLACLLVYYSLSLQNCMRTGTLFASVSREAGAC